MNNKKTKNEPGCLTILIISIIVILTMEVVIPNMYNNLKDSVKQSTLEQEERNREFITNNPAAGYNYYDMEEANRDFDKWAEENLEEYEKHIQESIEAKQYYNENTKK